MQTVPLVNLLVAVPIHHVRSNHHLQDERAALAERAAAATADIAAVAGARFLASRWRAEAWPPLRQMLAGRPAPRP